MRTQMNFDRLRDPGVSDGQKRVEIARAVQFELRKSAIAHALLGVSLALAVKSGGGGPGVYQLAGVPAQVPDTKAFEAAIAKHYDLPELKAFGEKINKGIAELGIKYATQDQNPVLTTAAQSLQAWFHNNMPELDIGYLPLFDEVDLRGSSTSQFEINTTGAGITWVERKAGGKTEIRREFSEAQVIVKMLEFTAGLGILDRWLQFNQFWNVDEAVAEFRATEADKRAALHYGLFTAQGAGIDTAFATDDSTTFNNAAATIVRNTASSGYAVGANAMFDILVAPEKLGRVLAFLDAKRGSPMVAFGTQDQPIAFSVRNVIATRHVPAADTGYYLVLPGRKIKRGTWKDVTLESQRDIYASATDWVGTTQYNAALGDTNQVRRVKYA